MLLVRSFTVGPLYNNCYVIWDDVSFECAFVDAPIGAEVVVDFVNSLKLSPKYLINTHCHFDHVFNNSFFKERFNLKLAYHKNDELLLMRMVETAESFGYIGVKTSHTADIYLKEGDTISLGGETIRIIETPGHSPGSITLLTTQRAFVGDVLFNGGIGRYDLPGANPHDLYHSLVDKLFTLPSETIVLPGHGEATTIGAEKEDNPFVEYLLSELGQI